MWKTPFKSPATTAAISETIGSARSDNFGDQITPFPNIIAQNPDFNRLYEKIYKSQEKAYESITEQEQKQELDNIKETIASKLLHEAKQKSFNKKYGRSIKSAQSSRKVFKNAHRSLLGLTRKEQNSQKLVDFLMDHRKAVQLQEQARLVQYHLRDKQKTKRKIDYINRIELSDKHRRTQPQNRDRSNKLFKVGNEMNYHLLRKTAYIRNDKLMSQSLARAKNNPTYCRMNNFSQIQYILHQDNCNLMITREIPKDPQKEHKYNTMRKLFISVALSSESMRTYYDYVREKEFGRLVDMVLPATEDEQLVKKVTREYVMGVIKKIVKYKQNKVIHFEDFIQIFTTIKDERGYDTLQVLLDKYQATTFQNVTPSKITSKAIDRVLGTNLSPQNLLYSPLDALLQQHQAQIASIITHSKFQVIVKKIYQLNSHKIIGREYLALRDILEIMKNVHLVPKIVTMNKFMYYSYWYQRRREGYSAEEFVRVQTAIGVDLGGVGGLEGYFGRFDMQAILAKADDGQ